MVSKREVLDAAEPVTSVGTPFASTPREDPTRRKALQMGTTLTVTAVISESATALELSRDRLARIHDEALGHGGADQSLIDLCQKCTEALHRFKACFTSTRGIPFEQARNMDKEQGERASALYDAEVAPVMRLIEETPAVTLAGFAAKAQVFILDDIQITGSDEAEVACIQMMEDLAKLSPLVERVPTVRA